MVLRIPSYHPPSSQLWHGRKDSLTRECFYQRVTCLDINAQPLNHSENPVIVGFKSDAGVQRNLGRVGARQGPDQLRQHLANLACHSTQNYIDIGDIVCSEDQLEQAQQEFSEVIAHCQTQGHETIAFGGGHEIGWAHFQGLTEQYPKLGIINLDAHFDIRPTHESKSTSGTPFWQVHEYCEQNNLSFNYCCLGIQSAANTESLFEQADAWNVAYLTAEQINNESFPWQTAFLDDFLLHHTHIYLTICLDAFAECFAPGVSAPQPMGLNPWRAMPLLKYIKQTGKVVSFDVAELSPPLDKNNQTARLAAMIVAELLNYS